MNLKFTLILKKYLNFPASEIILNSKDVLIDVRFIFIRSLLRIKLNIED